MTLNYKECETVYRGKEEVYYCIELEELFLRCSNLSPVRNDHYRHGGKHNKFPYTLMIREKKEPFKGKEYLPVGFDISFYDENEALRIKLLRFIWEKYKKIKPNSTKGSFEDHLYLKDDKGKPRWKHSRVKYHTLHWDYGEIDMKTIMEKLIPGFYEMIINSMGNRSLESEG